MTMNRNEAVEVGGENLLTLKELAARINVPASTIYFWVAHWNLPVHRCGRRLRFNYAEVSEFLAHRRSHQDEGRRS
jgi:excisionase family DNA binding protein